MIEKKYTDGELSRYNYFLAKVEILAKKYQITIEQAINILEDNLKDFSQMYNMVEIDKFIFMFLNQKKVEVKKVYINLENYKEWPPEDYLIFNNHPTQKDINIVNNENRLLIIELTNQDDIDYILTIENIKQQYRIVICVNIQNIPLLSFPETWSIPFYVINIDIKEWVSGLVRNSMINQYEFMKKES